MMPPDMPGKSSAQERSKRARTAATKLKAGEAAAPETIAQASPLLDLSPRAKDPNKYVCIHGHFYQPPRDNPWLETVEVQDSAAPYHDWNDRITAECYAPNGASRIVNLQNEIVRIVNNYSRMSYNFGPTLLSWLKGNAPRTYRMVTDADLTSRQRYGGHGSAMAQVYNHIIMPLASERDALTQIRWGKADFEYRFGREPEGMWLAETAVNRQCLDLMAQEGILFTVLAPRQCARVRALAAPGLFESEHPQPGWQETRNASVDPTHPYIVKLDEGRSIAVFFYDGPVSRAVAFEGLLNSGETFEARLLGAFPPPDATAPKRAQLVHIATDGESYGHHHKHGEMALSYGMHLVEQRSDARLTNYGEFLEKFPPTYEAEVVDNSSWSCEHGVERWRSNCGCNGGKAGWNQEWRKPLREALDWLRDTTAPLSLQVAAPLFKDLWAARDAYISVILDRAGEENAFFQTHATHDLSPEERVAALKLMELQRQAQLMYTSCGWFFDEISGIETIQIIAYAARMLQLAGELFGEAGESLEEQFIARLATAKSNVPAIGDGAGVYRRFVKAMRVGLEQVGAHYAISSIFRSYPEEGEIFCYDVRRNEYEVFTSGRGRLALGRAQVHSRVTEESEDISFAVLHLGDQNLSAAVKSYAPAERGAFDRFTQDVREAINSANLPEVIRQIDRYFGQTTYSLKSLFADEQHRILRTILDATLSEVETSLRKIYEDHASLLHFLSQSGMPKPPALELAAKFALNAGLRNAIEAEKFDATLIQSLLQRSKTDQVALDEQLLGYASGQRMKRAMVELEDTVDAEQNTSSRNVLMALEETVNIAGILISLPFEVNLWQAQNIWNTMLRKSNGNHWSAEWKDLYLALGRKLNISVEQLVVEEGVSTL